MPGFSRTDALFHITLEKAKEQDCHTHQVELQLRAPGKAFKPTESVLTRDGIHWRVQEKASNLHKRGGYSLDGEALLLPTECTTASTICSTGCNANRNCVVRVDVLGELGARR